ncbi:hypothetical protein HKX42_00605 [Salinisphaera sp. USBA-960]|nr:hypothetical protein [Salifodinibacter halophilus]NNC25384.1 hypothetical protein [Salifodinibacter halophilus]
MTERLTRRLSASIWGVGVLTLAAIITALATTGSLNLQTRLTDLLPAPQQSPAVTRATAQLASQGDDRLVILIHADNREQRQRAATVAADKLRQSSAFAHVAANGAELISPGTREKIRHLYFSHRFHLLAPDDRAALARLAEHQDTDNTAARDHFLQRARRRLATPGFASGQRFLADPLGLSRAMVQHTRRNTAPGISTTPSGQLTATGPAGEHFAVILAKSQGNPFSMTGQSVARKVIGQARDAVHQVTPDANVLISGAIRHAAVASARARFETTVIGLGSLAGIILLMLWLFASLRPLAGSLCVVAGGVLTAIVATRLIFGNIHIFTVVFGASLVGVAVDYCLHFFAERWRHPDSGHALRAIAPAITLGLVTSAAAYGGMAIAPFPGLRQIAVFTTFGLAGTWLGVMLLLPGLGGTPPRRGVALGWASIWLRSGPALLARQRPRTVIAALVFVIAGASIVTAIALHPDDELGSLYNPPSSLIQADKQIARVLGASATGQAILIRGQSRAQTLAREQALVAQLTQSQHLAARVRAITTAYLPPDIQQKTYSRLAATLYASAGPVIKLLQHTGYPSRLVKRQQRTFNAQRGDVLEFKTWLASPAGRPYRSLWLGHVSGRYADLVQIQSVADQTRLETTINDADGAMLIDRPAQISNLLQHYRRSATWLLGAAYGMAWALLSVFLGVRRAALIVAAPLTASLLVSALFAITGWAFTIFNVMALLLLLGLGADYGIFLRFAGRDSAPTMTAVAASSTTTVAAFGLLAASATPPLHQFGVTLGLGVVLTFLITNLTSALGRQSG